MGHVVVAARSDDVRRGYIAESYGVKQGSRVQERGCTVHALCRTRTYDPLIKSQLLCQLS